MHHFEQILRSFDGLDLEKYKTKTKEQLRTKTKK